MRRSRSAREGGETCRRQDFQRLIEWCDRDAPFSWLKGIAGVALAVYSVVPTGTPHRPATALWTGDLALREVAGISELPEEPVHFGGKLEGAVAGVPCGSSPAAPACSRPGSYECFSPHGRPPTGI
jgi:hypothetical protein